MATLSKEAKRISLIIEEIEEYNQTISELEYQVCDVPEDEREGDIEDLEEEQKRLQDLVNTMTNDLKFDDDCVIEYDGKVTQVRRNGVLWIEYYPDHGWIEHHPLEAVQAVINDEKRASGIIEEL